MPLGVDSGDRPLDSGPVVGFVGRLVAEKGILELLKAAQGGMRSAASGILSSSQLDKFDAMLKRDLERHEAQQRMARIRSKIDPADPKSGSN